LREILIILAAFASDVLSRFRRWFTVRRVLGIVAVLIVLLLFRQFLLLGMDISFLFGLDLGLVTEVTALMIILSVRHRVMTATYVVRHWLYGVLFVPARQHHSCRRRQMMNRRSGPSPDAR